MLGARTSIDVGPGEASDALLQGRVIEGAYATGSTRVRSPAAMARAEAPT
jgi:hypothetical protein